MDICQKIISQIGYGPHNMIETKKRQTNVFDVIVYFHFMVLIKKTNLNNDWIYLDNETKLYGLTKTGKSNKQRKTKRI